ncbi:AmiS/UreI family transporter [Arthrobacter sp. D3-16]
MPHLCLLLSGAALLINGLAMLGYLPRRDAGFFSLAVGSIQTALALGYLSTTGTEAPGLLSAAGMILFGLTYAYAGLDVMLDLGSKGLGWFCGMVAFVGLLLAAAWLRDDPLLAVLWLCWSTLWGLFFASMALGLTRVDVFTGWSLVLTSQVTATLPAVLGITGLWPRSLDAAAGAAVLLTGVFLAAGALARRTQVRHGASAPGGDVQPSHADLRDAQGRH